MLAEFAQPGQLCMRIVKRYWPFIVAVIIISVITIFSIYRLELLAGCTGSPCNELRKLHWEGIIGAVIGVMGAYWIARRTMLEDQRLRVEENNRPIIQRISSIDEELSNSLSHFEHVQESMIRIATKLKEACSTNEIINIDSFAETHTVDIYAVESSMKEAETTLREVHGIYADRLTPEDNKRIRAAINRLDYHAKLGEDLRKRLNPPYPATFSELDKQAAIADLITDKSSTFPKHIKQIRTDLQTISNRLHGRL